jgi:hypothetical protein
LVSHEPRGAAGVNLASKIWVWKNVEENAEI